MYIPLYNTHCIMVINILCHRSIPYYLYYIIIQSTYNDIITQQTHTTQQYIKPII